MTEDERSELDALEKLYDHVLTVRQRRRRAFLRHRLMEEEAFKKHRGMEDKAVHYPPEDK